MAMAQQALVYSYLRFSDMVQADGDSIRRQDSGAKRWADRNGLPFDDALTLTDRGASAYHGVHRSDPDRYALAYFLHLVSEGEVPRGSYLVLENLDRLSREKPTVSMTLLLNLISHGIRIVQLLPSELIIDSDSGAMPLMIALMAFDRGHGESAIKSERITAYWANARGDARAGRVVNCNLPYWVRRNEHDKTLELIPERAETIRRVFALAAEGNGALRICRALRKESRPTFNRVGKKGNSRGGRTWTACYVRRLLTDRRVLGEHTFRAGDRLQPDGPPIAGYYPRVIEDDEWELAQVAMAGNRRVGVRDRKYVNLFAGLLKSALDGSSMIRCQGSNYPVLDSLAGRRGAGSACSFPFYVFEEGVLRELREVNVNGLADADEAADIKQHEARKAEANRQLEELAAALEEGASATLAKAVRHWEGKLAEAEESLRAAIARQARPVTAAWAECKTLAAGLAAADDKEGHRARIRSAMRRVGTSGYVVIASRGKVRFAAVQLSFTEPPVRRSFAVIYRAAGNGRKAAAWTHSDILPDNSLDLSRREDAVFLRRRLEVLDLEAITAKLRPLDVE